MLTPAQLLERRDFIGASEAAAILDAELDLDLDPFDSPLAVWRAKVEGVVNPGNVYTRIGDALEAVTIAQYAEEFGVTVLPSPGSVRHPKYPHLAATPDGIVEGSKRRTGIEAKAPVTFASRRKWWNKNGEPCAPDSYFVQAQIQAEVCDFDAVHLIALIDGVLEVRLIERDRELGAAWAATLAEWWDRYVVPRVEPPPRDVGERAESVARRFSRSTGRMLPATDADRERGDVLAKLKAQAKDLEARIEAVEVELKERIGDADGIEGVATWKSDANGRPAWKSIALALNPPPELVAAHTSAPGRSFRLVTKKGPSK